MADNLVKQELAFRNRGFYQFSEIDASNFYIYRFGSEFSVSLFSDTVNTEVDDFSGLLRINRMDLGSEKYTPVYSRFYRLSISFTSLVSFNADWVLLVDNKDSYTKSIKVKKGVNSFSAVLPSTLSFFNLQQFLTNSGSISVVSVKVDCVHRADSRVIRSRDLNRSAFYIQELFLKPGESISVDDDYNILSNLTGVPRHYRFDKPLSTSGFKIVSGNPEVVFYCLEEESRY